MKKLLIFIILCASIYAYLNYEIPYIPRPPKNFKVSNILNIWKKRKVAETNGQLSSKDQFFKKAFDMKRRNVQAGGSGRVIKILTDEFGGSKRQRFIVALDSGQQLIVKHNIDDVARPPVAVGFRVEFYGKYNWTRDGGEISKTDSRSRNSAGGWIRFNGQTYK